MPKNDFESANFANFEEVVHNFDEKMLIFNICRHGLIPNFIKKIWTVFIPPTTFVAITFAAFLNYGN